MIRNWEKRRNFNTKRAMWGVMLEHRREQGEQRHKINTMLKYFRKFHLA